MDKSPIEIYNSPEVADLWRMKAECHEYYVSCFNRFKRGEQFYPHGFARTDYSTTAQLLVRTLHSLGNRDVLSQSGKFVLRLHFNKNFEYVPIWNADWSRQYYLPNFWQLWQPYEVHHVKQVIVTKEEGRKRRSVILDDGSVIPMDSAYFLRQPRQSFGEQSLQDKLLRKDWQLVLNREIADFYRAPNLKSSSSLPADILPFRPANK